MSKRDIRCFNLLLLLILALGVEHCPCKIGAAGPNNELGVHRSMGRICRINSRLFAKYSFYRLQDRSPTLSLPSGNIYTWHLARSLGTSYFSHSRSTKYVSQYIVSVPDAYFDLLHIVLCTLICVEASKAWTPKQLVELRESDTSLSRYLTWCTCMHVLFCGLNQDCLVTSGDAGGPENNIQLRRTHRLARINWTWTHCKPSIHGTLLRPQWSR
jgi:hypothetical protein